MRQVYERLWHEAEVALQRNDLELDPHLPDKARDLRRGLSMALRPSSAVQASISTFLGKMKEVVPGQYFYRPEEFHVTVLSVISGSESWQDQIHHLPAHQAIIEQVIKRHRTFSIAFRGVTASRAAVMIQGFPTDDTLMQIRDDLRETLRLHKLAGQLDVRYKINSAHITVMRFCHAATDVKRLLDLLKDNRTTDFGETSATNLELILGDWYASADTAQTLSRYQLQRRPPG